MVAFEMFNVNLSICSGRIAARWNVTNYLPSITQRALHVIYGPNLSFEIDLLHHPPPFQLR